LKTNSFSSSNVIISTSGLTTGSRFCSTNALFKALGATISKASSNKACLPILEIKTLRGTFPLRKPGMLIFLLNFQKLNPDLFSLLLAVL